MRSRSGFGENVLVDAEWVQEGVKVMWFPEWLYKQLPLLYLASGGICVLLFGVSPSILLSVALLVWAALLTLSWRRTARQATAARSRRLRPRS